MDLDEYKEMTARREYIPGGSPAHELMHGMSAEAQKITSRINCGYHTQEELRERALREQRRFEEALSGILAYGLDDMRRRPGEEA